MIELEKIKDEFMLSSRGSTPEFINKLLDKAWNAAIEKAIGQIPVEWASSDPGFHQCRSQILSDLEKLSIHS